MYLTNYAVIDCKPVCLRTLYYPHISLQGMRKTTKKLRLETHHDVGTSRICQKLYRLSYFLLLLLVGWDQVPCIAATSGLLYQPQMIGEGDCGAIGGMNIGRGYRSTRRKHAPAPLCPPQIPLDQTRDRTRASAVGNQLLTA
jgi:hypothetical protein